MELQKSNKLVPIYCVLVIVAFIAILVIPSTRDVFKAVTAAHPYILGFIKFALLATIGELFAIRLSTGVFRLPKGIVARALVWGFLGAILALLFKLYSNGIIAIMDMGLLPGGENKFLFALFSSCAMNCTFAPTMMVFHKITDKAIDMKADGEALVSLKNVASKVDWVGLVGFTIAVTIPFFWIPAHTISFMLPGEYQIIMAAFLSIALGLILGIGTNTSKKQVTVK